MPERYTVAEWRKPYDAITAMGGFRDVSDDEASALRPELSEAERVRAPVIMPYRRGGQKRIRPAREKAIDAARGARGGHGGGRGSGRGGGRGGGLITTHSV